MKKFNILSKSHELGEYVTTLELDKKDVPENISIEDIEITADVIHAKSFVPHITELVKITREVEKIEVTSDKILIHLVTPIADKLHLHRVGGNTQSGYHLKIKGEDYCCDKIINPLVDVFEDLGTDKIKYRLFKPQSDKSLPLVIWLHGVGEIGIDNRLHISNNMVVNWAKDDCQKYFGEDGAYIASIQARDRPHKPMYIKEAIDKIIKENNIDMSRIYIGGCSMGGAGVHQMLDYCPELFAAAFPVCGTLPLEDSTIKTLAKQKTPVYYIFCIGDSPDGLTLSMKSVKILQENGVDSHICLFDSIEVDGNTVGPHAIWIYVHNNLSCVGDNESARTFHKGEYTTTREALTYNGKEISYFQVRNENEICNVNDPKTWNMLDGKPFVIENLKPVSYEISCMSESPVDLGYDSLFHWIASQKKEI